MSLLADTFEANADPELQLVETWRVDHDGESVARVRVALTDPTQTTVEGPPLRLRIREGLLERVVPLTAHGVAAQLRGPAVLTVEGDPETALKPGSGTWRGALEVRTGRLASEIVSVTEQITGVVTGRYHAIPFGARYFRLDAEQITARIYTVSPATADILWRSQNSNGQSFAEPFAVPRGASLWRLSNQVVGTEQLHATFETKT